MRQIVHRADGLDALRGLAALAVVLYHVVLLGGLPLPNYVTPVVHRLGLGVPFFYILSAFTLSYVYDQRLRTRAQIGDYALKRFTRIAPLFYVMIAVWAAVLWTRDGIQFTKLQIGLNATFLFNLVPGYENSLVWAGWSIGVEMLFYTAFPLLLRVCTSVPTSAAVLAFTLVVAFVFLAFSPGTPQFKYFHILSQLPFFATGMLSYRVWQTYRPGALVGLGAFAVWAAVWILDLGHVVVLGVDIDRYLVAAAFPFVLLAVMARPALAANRAMNYVGERGYSVYLLHPLAVLYVLPTVHTLHVGRGPVLAATVGFMGAALMTISAAAITYELIEKPFMRAAKLRPWRPA